MDKFVLEVLKKYSRLGNVKSFELYGNGHINTTYLVKLEERDIILQRINTDIFKEPLKLMENIVGITRFLREKIITSFGDPERETLNILKTDDGKYYYSDDNVGFWRIYSFVKDTVCYEKVENSKDFYESALAFGKFQKKLAAYPVDTLHETIPDFHNTVKKLEVFKDALKLDPFARSENLKEEIKFVLDREKDVLEFADLIKKGVIPLKVTHNDTKLNNVLMDKKTGRAICVIDLDTVMSGFAIYDFGDSIRFGANNALEDETDLSLVSCNLELFKAYTEGFLQGCEGSLSDMEIKFLPMGAKLMTFECGVRFLTDYILGDVYFKISRETHNIDRARNQFKLVEDIESKMSSLNKIVAEVAEKHI